MLWHSDWMDFVTDCTQISMCLWCTSLLLTVSSPTSYCSANSPPGRPRSVGEVDQVAPQSALSVKNPSDQSKAQTQPKQRLSRAHRTNGRWKKPIVEDVHSPAPHELDWVKEVREKPSKHTGNQKENHYLSRHGEFPIMHVKWSCQVVNLGWHLDMQALGRLTRTRFFGVGLQFFP